MQKSPPNLSSLSIETPGEDSTGFDSDIDVPVLIEDLEPLEASLTPPRVAPPRLEGPDTVAGPALDASEEAFVERVFTAVAHVEFRTPLAQESKLWSGLEGKLQSMRQKNSKAEHDLARIGHLWRRREVTYQEQASLIRRKQEFIDAGQTRVEELLVSVEEQKHAHENERAQWESATAENSRTLEAHAAEQSEAEQKCISLRQSLEVNKERFANRMHAREQELTNARELFNELSSRASGYEQEITALQPQVADLLEQAEHSREQCDAQNAQLLRARADLNEHREQTSAQIGELSASLEAAQTRAGALDTRSLSLTKQLEETQNRLRSTEASHHQEVDGLRTRAEAVKRTVIAARRAIEQRDEASGTRDRQLVEANGRHSSRVEEFQRLVARRDKRNHQLEATVEQRRNDTATLEQQLQQQREHSRRSTERVTALEQQLEQYRRECGRLETALTEQQSTASTVQTALETVRAEVRLLRSDKANLTTRLRDLEDATNSARHQ